MGAEQALVKRNLGDLDLIRHCYRNICNSNNTKQPYKWGYQLFVLCGTKGLVHSFDIFTGKIDPAPGQPDIGASGNILLKH